MKLALVRRSEKRVKKLLEAARRREIDVVLVWRWIAGAGQSLIYGATLQELHHLGVGFISLTEEILRERTLAGLAQAEWKRARCVAANAIAAPERRNHRGPAHGQ